MRLGKREKLERARLIGVGMEKRGCPEASSSMLAQGTGSWVAALRTVPTRRQLATGRSATREAPKRMAAPDHQKAKNTAANSPPNVSVQRSTWRRKWRRRFADSSSSKLAGRRSSGLEPLSGKLDCIETRAARCPPASKMQ